MRLNKRLQKLEQSSPPTCPACAPRRIKHHHAYTLPDGTEYLVPPLPPEGFPCTCRKPAAPQITTIIVSAGEAVSREQAEEEFRQSPTFGTWRAAGR